MIKRCLALVCLAALFLSGCSTPAQEETEETPETRSLIAMDTTMTLEAYGPAASDALDRAEEELLRLDALWSVTNTESEISHLNRDKHLEVSADTAAVLARAKEISAATDGLFSVTTGPLVTAWGFTTENHRVPDAAERAALCALIDDAAIGIQENTVTLPENASVNLGGIAKGYASARIAEIFTEAGVESGLVSLGGNVQAIGKKPDGSLWLVGILDPIDTNALVATLEVADCAVITSGGYQRYFEMDGVRYHHILDPRTGSPSESGLASVTIVSKDGTLADGLSTALFVMGEEDALSFWRAHREDFDALLVTEDGRVIVTEGIADQVSCTSGKSPEVAQ